MKQKLRPLEVFMNLLFFVCGLIAVVFVLFISIYLIVSGLPAIREIGLVDFLFGTEWASTAAEPKFGILPFILTSIYGTAGAIVLGVPVGFMTAVFLAKVAPPRLASLVRPAVDLLAGIPSVVYGLIGMMVLVPAVRVAFHLPDGASLFCAILVLAVCFCTVPALAADDPLDIVNNLSDFIFSCIKAIGIIILGWGVVQLGMSVQSHDATQRTQGVLCLFGGLLIAFAKEILTAIGVV